MKLYDSVEDRRIHGLSRDLRITGVTQRGSVWFYHVEVLCSWLANDDVTGPMVQDRISSSHGKDAGGVVTDGNFDSLPPLVRYSVQRRFTEFRSLHLALKDTATGAVAMVDHLPPFPDAGLLSYLRSNDPSLLRHRQAQLESFVRALDECADTKWWKPFVRFLAPNPAQVDQWLCRRSTSRLVLSPRPVSRSTQPPLSAPGALESQRYVSLSCVQSPQLRFDHPRLARAGASVQVTPLQSLVEVVSWNQRPRAPVAACDAVNGAAKKKKTKSLRDLEVHESSLYKLLNRLLSTRNPPTLRQV